MRTEISHLTRSAAHLIDTALLRRLNAQGRRCALLSGLEGMQAVVVPRRSRCRGELQLDLAGHDQVVNAAECQRIFLGSDARGHDLGLGVVLLDVVVQL